jgi:hypothetical protein
MQKLATAMVVGYTFALNPLENGKTWTDAIS